MPFIKEYFFASFSDLDIIFSIIEEIGYMIGIGLMIFLIIKYPNNIFVKVLMWLVIISIILSIIGIFVIVIILLSNAI